MHITSFTEERGGFIILLLIEGSGAPFIEEVELPEKRKVHSLQNYTL
jgi:hypothetical protein